MSSPPHPKMWLHKLPPTLRTSSRITTVGCSKAPRGLRFPVGVRGLFTTKPGSLGPGRGQWGARYAIHASRQLSGKVLRYLKRVIVTPAVYRRFTRLYPGFTYRHWAGVGGCTQPFGFATTYVFIKQSTPPCHCDQLQSSWHPLSRSYGANLPNSLGQVIPNTPRASHPETPVSVLGTVT